MARFKHKHMPTKKPTKTPVKTKVKKALPRLAMPAWLRRIGAPIKHFAVAHKIIAVILVIVLGYTGYRFTVTRIEKFQFRKAEQAIAAVVKNLEQSSVAPKIEKVCAAPDAKFGKAAMQCGINIESSISDLSEAAETRLLNNYINSINKTNLFSKETPLYTVEDAAFGKQIHYKLAKEDIDCSLIYQTIRSTSRFKVSLGCAVLPHFPIY
jgi:hypothetical protein